MKFNLETDEAYSAIRKQINDDIDSLIDSSLSNLSIAISKALIGEEQSIIDETLKIIKDDLEEKRKSLKKHFLGQIETMTKEAYENAISQLLSA